MLEVRGFRLLNRLGNLRKVREGVCGGARTHEVCADQANARQWLLKTFRRHSHDPMTGPHTVIQIVVPVPLRVLQMEAILMSAINHENIVRTYKVGVTRTAQSDLPGQHIMLGGMERCMNRLS